jgi:hypothetical protein
MFEKHDLQFYRVLPEVIELPAHQVAAATARKAFHELHVARDDSEGRIEPLSRADDSRRVAEMVGAEENETCRPSSPWQVTVGGRVARGPAWIVQVRGDEADEFPVAVGFSGRRGMEHLVKEGSQRAGPRAQAFGVS